MYRLCGTDSEIDLCSLKHDLVSRIWLCNTEAQFVIQETEGLVTLRTSPHLLFFVMQHMRERWEMHAQFFSGNL